MRLPAQLEAAVDELASAAAPRALVAAALRLSARYQSGDFRTPAIASDIERIAYLATRMPATYAANHHVFRQFREAAPTLAIRSVLDLGAGPGTSLWAAREAFPEMERAGAVERDGELLACGKRLAAGGSGFLRTVEWRQEDLESCPLPPGFDLVVLSYALGEFSPARAQAIATRALKAATQALIIIEPGTPRSFQMMAGIRQALLDAGLTLVAPCPHHQECPLRRGNDWCHFAERVERTALHRRAKGGELGYEDEKFCYLAAMTPGALRSAQATQEMARPEARIVRHPRFHPGHVQLSLCTATGLQVKAVGKSQKQSYRAARKAHWGDGWPGANREP